MRKNNFSRSNYFNKHSLRPIYRNECGDIKTTEKKKLFLITCQFNGCIKIMSKRYVLVITQMDDDLQNTAYTYNHSN